MRRHINATTAKARNKGLEGAAPGTSASLIYTDHKGRTIEGRQPYPVRVYADGAYVGILNPGETIDTFAASRIDEVPVMEDGTGAKNVDLTDTRDFEKKKVGSDEWLNRVIAEQNDRGNPISMDQAKEFQSFVLTELDKGQAKSLGFEDWIDMSQEQNIPWGTQGFNITSKTTWDPQKNMFMPDPSGTENNMMFFDEWEDGDINQWVKTHEVGHNWNTEIPFNNTNNDFLGSTYFSDTDMFNEFARNQGEEFGQTAQDYAGYKHQEHEIRSEKTAFERALADAGLWDPTKKFTSDDLRNILNNRGKLDSEAREIFKALGGKELAERDYNIQELEYYADGQHLTPELQSLKDEIESMYNELGSRFNPSVNMDANTWGNMSSWEKEKYIEEHGTTPVQRGEDYDNDGVWDYEWTEDMTDKQKNAYLRSQARYAELDKWGDNAVYGTDALSGWAIGSPGMFAYNNQDITEGLDSFNKIAGGFEMSPPLKEVRNKENMVIGYTDDPNYIGLGEPNNVIPLSEESTAQFNNQSDPMTAWNSYVDELFTANEAYEEDKKLPWRERKIQSSWNLKIDENLDYVDPPQEGDEDYDPENPLVSNNLYDKCYDENGIPTGNCNEQELKRIADNNELHNANRRMDRINYTLQSLGDIFGSSTATHIDGSPFDPNTRGVVKTSLNSPLINNKYMELYPEGSEEHSAMTRIMKTYDRLYENREEGKHPTMDREAFTLEFFNDLSLVQKGLMNTRQALEIDRQDKVDNYYKLLQEHLDKGSKQQIQEQKDILNEDIENHKIIDFMNRVYSQNDQAAQQVTQFARSGGPAKYQNAGNVIKNEWNKLKNQSFPIPEIGISAIDDKLRGHVITPTQEIRNAKTGEVNKELTEFLDKNYSNLLKIYNNTYDWKDQSWYEKIGSITGSLPKLFQIFKENSKSGTFDFYQDGSNVQIQSPYDVEIDLIKSNFEKTFSQEDRDYINFINTRTPFRDETTIGDDPELFYLDLYNTELTAEELLEYYLWKDEMAYRRSLLNKTNIEEELHKLDMDLGAYDVQGWWKSGDYENTDTDGHGTDKWKKPNHPTFSNESKYASNYELPEGEEDTRSNYLGGTWSETGAYTPSIHNMYTNERLHWEFNREPHRPEHLYMGNDLIYNHQHFPIIYDFEKTKILDNYEDGGGVKNQEEIPQYIEEPLTAKMQEKLDKMYRDNQGVPQDLELNTFDTSTEEGMIKYLKHTENSIMKGYNAAKDRWYPHDDGEGNWTIGYGHHIGAHIKDTGYNIEDLKKNGLSSAEVDDLLKMDMKRESDLIAKNVPGWENLDTRQKNALLDIQFNIIGNVWTEFPSFTEAVVDKDWQNVVIHGSRAETAKNPDGTFKPNQRNTAFYKSMIEPMMNEWRPKIKNPNYVEELDLSHIMMVPPAVQDNTYVDMPIFPTIEVDKIKKFEDGSEVTADPPSYNLQEYFSNNLIETTTRYPNFSDQDIYKYYLENKSPEEGFSVFFPDVSVLNEPLNELTPVPFYSSNFSTAIDTPNFYRETGTPCASNGQLIEGCAGGLQIAYEFNTPLSKDQVRNVNGIKGNAWQMHQNVVDAGGQSLFNYSNLLGIDEDWRSNNYNMSSDDLFYEFNKARDSYNPNDLSALEASLEVGDLVDILYDGSSYQPEAIQDGFGTNINSHVGKITEKDGQLYVTHNIKGKWYSDRLDNVLQNQRYSAGGKMMIVGGYRPRYESGLIDGVSYKNRIENPVDGYNSLVSMDYLNHLGMTMPNIQSDFGFSDSDSSLVAKASYGTFGKESTFATGARWDAKNYSRDLLRGYKGLNDQEGFTLSPLHATISYLLDKKFTDGTLDMDSLSEGMTQIKLDEFVKDDHIASLFSAYNITDPDVLYTTEGSSRATALVHSLNLKLINDYFSGHDLSDQVKMNMMHMAFNKGIDNVLRDFVNDENIVTPSSFQKGHDIYKNIHTNEESYSYTPNKISGYIDYDHSKMKANSNRVANYDVESLSGFEQGYMDLMEEYEKKKETFNQTINENKRDFNTGQRKIINKVDKLIKKANKTKDIKYINKAKQKLENFSSNIDDKLKKETKTVKKGLNKIKSLFR